jgi:hypothetical protein
MSKDAYFEMCEMLGQEPLEHEIPVDPGDFPDLVQQTLVIYSLLEDRWDSMGGGYLGKNYNNVFDLFSLYEIFKEEAILVLEFLQHIDVVRSKLVAEKIKAKSPATK